MKNTYKLSDKEVAKFIARVKEWMGLQEEKNDEPRKT